MSLEDLREDITRTDRQIVRLLDERAAVAKRIAEEKTRRGLPLRDPGREADVIAGLAAMSNGSMPSSGLAAIYRRIIEESLAVQGEPVAAPPPAACPGHGKRDVPAEVVENKEIAPGFRQMRLRAPELADAFRPGQFFQLDISEGGGEPFLRRPFAPSEIDRNGFAFVYAVVGRGTGIMAGLAIGDRVRVLAPLGNGYTPVEPGRSVALVGGGCGGPSLGPLAKHLATAGVKTTVVLGAKTAGALLCRDTLARHSRHMVTATDDGSHGVAGTAIQALRDRLGAHLPDLARIYACGPVPMLKAAAALARQHGIPCEVSLEERMACGFGACVGCVVETKDADGGIAYRRVCHDGPVFDAAELAWDLL